MSSHSINKPASLIGDRSQSGQDAYLYTIAANASRLGELPEVEPRDFGDINPAYELDLIYRDTDAPFLILALQENLWVKTQEFIETKIVSWA